MANFDDPWGDDEGEAEMLTALYEQEEKLQRQNQQHLLEERTQNVSSDLRANTSRSSSTHTSTSTTTQILEARRQALVHDSYVSSSSTTSSSCRMVQPEPVKANSKPTTGKDPFTLLTEERAKNKELSTKMLQNKGENALLRKQMENLKAEQHFKDMERKNKEREDKQKYDDDKRKYELEISALKTNLSVAENQLINYKSKIGIKSVSPKISVGGASQSSYRSTNTRSQMVGAPTSTPPTKFKSDPNLRASKIIAPSPPVIAVPQLPKEAHKEFVNIAVQVEVNQEAVNNEKIYKQVFGGSNTAPIDFGKLISPKLSDTSKRQQTFETLRNRLDQKFLSLNPIITKIVNVAPQEIMLTFVPDLEIRECAPDVIDSMFYQFMIEERTKRENETNGESTKKKYPLLPSVHRRAVLHFEQVESKIQTNFVNGSSWEALREIKMHMKTLLNAIKGEMRFTLYEAGNVTSFLRLLVWTKYMWRFVVFDEEIPEIVNVHGKILWAKELREWTGLILKADWRDFYVPELETTIRQQTLAILESIVSLGYFEQHRRRDEIMYRILKDTLEKERHRSALSFKHCINIISWSIADKSILDYLCMNKNQECLAHILGENVLKCFKEIKNPYHATDLFVHYVNLLFALELPQTQDYFASSIARPNKDGIGETVEKDVQPTEDSFMDTNQSFDFTFSQFACSNKYTFDDESRDRVLNLKGTGNCNQDNQKSWINPQQWEIAVSSAPRVNPNPTPVPCQCRKILLGNAFTMLHGVFQFWKQTFTAHDRDIETQETLDATNLEILNENQHSLTSPSENKRHQDLLRKVDYIKSFYEKISDVKTSEDGNQLSDEWTWDGILQDKNIMEQFNHSTAFKDKERPDKIFDYAIRRGLVLMTFCEVEIQGNKAQVLGSEPFWYSTRLPSELRFYEENVRLTKAEKSALSNLVILSYGSQVEDEEENLSDSSMDDQDDDDSANDPLPYLPRQLNYDDCVKGLSDFRQVPKHSIEELPERIWKLMKIRNVDA